MRLFVAISPPEALSSDLERWARAAGSTLPGARFVPAENLHLTLRFLGEVGSATPGTLRDAIETSIRGDRAFSVELGAPGLLPRGSRARVAHLAIQPSEALSSLRDRVARSVEESLGLDPELRPFRPHLTLARSRRPWGRAARDGWRARSCPLSGTSFEVTYVDLMESVLSPSGARYRSVGRTALEA